MKTAWRDPYDLAPAKRIVLAHRAFTRDDTWQERDGLDPLPPLAGGLCGHPRYVLRLPGPHHLLCATLAPDMGHWQLRQYCWHPATWHVCSDGDRLPLAPAGCGALLVDDWTTRAAIDQAATAFLAVPPDQWVCHLCERSVWEREDPDVAAEIATLFPPHDPPSPRLLTSLRN